MGDHVGVVRNDGGLRRALADIGKIASEGLPSMSLASHDRIANYDWIQALEASSMVVLAEIVARACLERTESRGSHYRDDFTGTNDADWRQNIVIRRRGGALSIDAALELEKA